MRVRMPYGTEQKNSAEAGSDIQRAAAIGSARHDPANCLSNLPDCRHEYVYKTTPDRNGKTGTGQCENGNAREGVTLLYSHY